MDYHEPQLSSSEDDSDFPHGAELVHEMRLLWHRIGRAEQPHESLAAQRQQYWALWTLKAGPRRMSDIAECTRISQTSLTGIIDRLEEHGLVHRERSGDDRRVVEVAITPAGAAALEEANAALTERIASVTGRLSAAERATFLRLLRKMNQPPHP